MAWKSALPGSPVVMCHQSNVDRARGRGRGLRRGGRSAADGAAADGAAADGAAVAPPPPNRRRPRASWWPGRRTCAVRVDTTRPPPVHATGTPILRVTALLQRQGAAKVSVRCQIGFAPNRNRPGSSVKPPLSGRSSRVRRAADASGRPLVATSPRSRPETFGMLTRWPSRARRRPPGAGRGPRRSPTSRAQAGVSVPTVSKVINGRADVSAETRRRVEAAIREHGYQRPAEHRPSGAAARGHLPRARERVGAGDRPGRRAGRGPAPARGRAVRDAGPADARAGAGSRACSRAGPTGVIAVFSDLSEGMRTQLRTRGIPFVVVDPTGEPLHDTPSIGATNWNGGLTATRHLLGLGHRRIGVIGGPAWILCSRARLDGYRAAMDEAGVPVDPQLDQPRRVPRRGGDRPGTRAARAGGPPDRDLRRQRPPGARRLPGRARGAAAHPGGPERRRLRRPAGRAVGRAAAHDGPPAAGRDGRGGRRARAPDGRRRGARPGARRARHGAGRPREHRAAPRLILAAARRAAARRVAARTRPRRSPSPRSRTLNPPTS